MFIAKEVGKTEKGNTYIILQDNSIMTQFHISVDVNNVIRYDCVENPISIEEIMARISTLENEGLDSQGEI